MACGRKDHWGSTLVSQSTYEVEYSSTPDSYLYGWVDEDTGWVKLICNAAGKLIIDPSEIFENVPTNNEHGKAPDSDWAYDHVTKPDVHHSRYVADTLGNYVWDAADTPRSYHTGVTISFVRAADGWLSFGTVVTFRGYFTVQDGGVMQIYCPYSPVFGGDFAKIRFGKYDNQGWSDWQDLAPDVGGMIATHATDASAHHTHVIEYKGPDEFDYDYGISIFKTDAEAGWPGTKLNIVTHWRNLWRNVQWAFDYTNNKVWYRGYYTGIGWTEWREVMTDLHKADPNAHHARYTDAEAQAACGLDGDLYWSCSGVHFDCQSPVTDVVSKNIGGYIEANTDGVVFVAGVFLPHGATVTGAEVFGNDAAGFETWTLNRIRLDTSARAQMADENINTVDDSILLSTIDNINYSYYFATSSLDIGDRIFGALISYTI